MNRREWLHWPMLIGLGISAVPTFAQNHYPDRPVRLVIPFAPGGQTDILGRRYAQRMSLALGQQFISENKGGAGGTMGSAEVARAKKDGYTLLMATSSTHAINPSAMDNIPYDAVKDFQPVAVLGIIPMVLAVHPSVKANNLLELIALIKANPGKFAYGSAGMGSINHLTGEMFKAQAGGLDYTHIPYKGSGQSVQDLLSGQVPTLMATFPSVINYHRTGKVRILAIFMETRAKAAPDVPTAIESGMPKMVSYTFNMVCAPAGIPANVLSTLSQATTRIMNDAAFKKELEDLVIEAVGDSSPDKAAKFMKEELARFQPIIKATGTKVQ